MIIKSHKPPSDYELREPGLPVGLAKCLQDKSNKYTLSEVYIFRVTCSVSDTIDMTKRNNNNCTSGTLIA